MSVGLSLRGDVSERPLRRIEYERLVELGMFAPDERIELLEGHLVQRMSPQNALHAGTVQRLTKILMRAVLASGAAEVRTQLPLALSDVSEPEPDLALVPPGDYLDAHPGRALLVVEVSDSSLEFDRTVKAELYARGGVPEYWIVDLQGGAIERHTEPCDTGYRTRRVHRGSETIRLAALAEVSVAVTDVLS